ncbi:exported protein family 4 [Plasmodium sp. DRC-Itaito]|nr:exported protein family 4 [Plasmodium sp. DRC-Itaito]
MNFFYVRILYVAIVICLCIFNYKDNATKWKKQSKCCKNNFYLLSSKRCLLQCMHEEPFEKKGSCGVLLKNKQTEEGGKKKIRDTMNIKPKNENNNKIVFKNLNYEEIKKEKNMKNKRVQNKSINDKGVKKISNKKQMGGKNIVYKDLKSNLLLNKNETNDNQKVEEIKQKIVKDLMKNKSKEVLKQMEIIHSDGTMKKIKNSLYNMIFRGVNFWKGLGIYLGALSGAAIGQMILTFILKFATFSTLSYSIYFSATSTLIAFCSFVGIIFLTIITVFCLLVWLWPSRGKLVGNGNRENKRDT